MATIVIKDLTDSMDLDRKAMTAISGGARARGRPVIPAQGKDRSTIRTTRIVDYPRGFSGIASSRKGESAK